MVAFFATPLLAGTVGGLLATWVTFAPCFPWIFLGAPFMERLRSNRAISAALSAETAAVVGVSLNLAIWFAVHVIWREVARIEVGAHRWNCQSWRHWIGRWRRCRFWHWSRCSD